MTPFGFQREPRHATWVKVIRDLVFRDPAKRVLTPEILDPRVATASIAVEIVTQRILPVIILMVVLRRIEPSGDLDRGDDGLVHDGRELNLALGVFRQPLLFR